MAIHPKISQVRLASLGCAPYLLILLAALAGIGIVAQRMHPRPVGAASAHR